MGGKGTPVEGTGVRGLVASPDGAVVDSSRPLGPTAIRRGYNDALVRTRVKGYGYLDIEESDGEVVFEDAMESPYLYSLAGEYDVGKRVRLFGTEVDGRCPVCNNMMRREAEKAYLESRDLHGCATMVGATDREMAYHLIEHYGPMLVEIGGVMGLGDMDQVEAGVRTAYKAGARGIRFGKTKIEDMKRMVRKSRGDWEEEGFDGLESKRASAARKADVPPRTGVDSSVVRDYAMDGRVILDHSALKPWTRERAMGELRKKAVETINFYDEMLDCRAKADRIYKEILDSGDPKFYGTAVAAIREKRGVVETLGKMSLIAKSLSEGREGSMMRVSSELADVMKAIGVDVGGIAEIAPRDPVPDEAAVAEYEILPGGEGKGVPE